MIALSIRQPWAWAIIRPDLTDPVERAQAYDGGLIKDIENRSWETRYRGDFLIHAGKEFDKQAMSAKGLEWFRDRGIRIPPADQLERGGIVGMANLFGCVKESDSPWFFGEFGFQLRRARPLRFMPVTGKLSFFETDYRIPT